MGKDSYLKIHSLDFNIDQIANSGQCFRIFKISSNIWKVIASGRSLKIHQEGIYDHIFECSEKEYNEIWLGYFDMRRDYRKIKEAIRTTNDPYLTAAIDYGYGIRILKQDLWETIVTFIISQRNSIPRIKNTIAKLCEPYEDQFPTPHLLEKYSENDFLSLGVGYRAKYLWHISRAVTSGDLELNLLKNMDYFEAVNFLKKFNGIGSKVANCIVLFGLHKIEAFPIDTWIKRIIDDQYSGNFNVSHFSGYEGLVQQYMFFYQRHLDGVKTF